MAYLITHFFEGGTEAQYRATLAAAHPAGGLPPGQTYHAAGPTEGGWMVVAQWDTKDACDAFMGGTLVPALQSLDDGLPGPPQEHACEIANLVTG